MSTDGTLQSRGFAVLDHPADIGFEAWASTLAQLFEESAAALTSILVDVDDLGDEHAENLPVELESGDLEGLMFNWLSEILFQFDCERRIFPIDRVRVSINRTAELYNLRADLSGRTAPQAAYVKTYVKAVTFHQMKIQERDGLWKATVYLDI